MTRPTEWTRAELAELIEESAWLHEKWGCTKMAGQLRAAVASLRAEKEVIYRRCVLFACPDSEHYYKEE